MAETRGTRENPRRLTREQAAREGLTDAVAALDAKMEAEGRPLSDRAPVAPSMTETPTGVTGVGGATSQAGLAQEHIDATGTAAENKFEAEQQDFANQEEFRADVQGDVDETVGMIDTARTEMEGDFDQVQAAITQARGELQQIPQQVQGEFQRLEGKLDMSAAIARGSLESREQAALAGVMEGKAAAMQAAVTGIHANINNQVAAIKANPNLSDAQKQSMISQVKLAGASSLAPAIGQNILAFNQLQADVATNFGTIIGNFESAVQQTKGAFLQTAGSQFAQAQIAAAEINGQLLNISANATASRANSQANLLAARSQAQMAGNDIALRSYAEFRTPFYDPTAATAAAVELGTALADKQFAQQLDTFGIEATMQQLEIMQGTPWGNAGEAFLSTLLASGNAPAAVAAGILSFFGSQGQRA